jgi:hypothetical protein
MLVGITIFPLLLIPLDGGDFVPGLFQVEKWLI